MPDFHLTATRDDSLQRERAIAHGHVLRSALDIYENYHTIAGGEGNVMLVEASDVRTLTRFSSGTVMI